MTSASLNLTSKLHLWLLLESTSITLCCSADGGTAVLTHPMGRPEVELKPRSAVGATPKSHPPKARPAAPEAKAMPGSGSPYACRHSFEAYAWNPKPVPVDQFVVWRGSWPRKLKDSLKK